MSRSEQIRYDRIMKKIIASFLLKSLLVAGLFGAAQTLVTPAEAASCSARAAQLASSKGGNILSVSASGNKCVIKLLIRSSNGPPKRKTFVVSK